jgi:glycosyltransferase involved in cell wall biosynthesis
LRPFSIILPVRNGGEYVKQCVHSILSQTYPHFNFIVLDNASNDGTAEWIASLADPRIVIHSSTQLLGIEENWSRIVTVPKNEFMTCIGHDDILDPDYLSVMDKLIDQYPDASLYLSHFRYIDSEGNKIRSCLPMAEKQLPEEVLSNFLQNKFNVSGTGYIMRSKDYDAIGGIPDYPSLLFADFELWLNLAKISYLAVAPQETFAFRIHQSTTTSSADNTMLLAFERFVLYLENLRAAEPKFATVIEENAETLLHFYCRGLTSRLLRTPLPNRKGLTVNYIIGKFVQYGSRLAPDKHYDPMGNKTVRMARLIDSNIITRQLFLLFKKIYSKPVVR